MQPPAGSTQFFAAWLAVTIGVSGSLTQSGGSASWIARAEALFCREPDWAAPLLWRSELRHVLATRVRQQSLTLELAGAIQAEAEDLMAGREYHVPSGEVLRLAAGSRCSAYDCGFVCLARQLHVPLVTGDRAVLTGFPGTAVALA